MAELISESITPLAHTFDASAMGRGEPGLPSGFRWLSKEYNIVAVVRAWKHSSREGGRAKGELYLRRHCYELAMDDGSQWSVYFERQSPKSGNPKKRWFLYTVEPGKTSKPTTDHG